MKVQNLFFVGYYLHLIQIDGVNFYVKGTKHLPLGLMMTSDLAARYKYSLKGTLKGTQQVQN